MEPTGNLVEARSVLYRSPFHSIHFWLITLMGGAAIALDAGLLIRYSARLSTGYLMLLIFPIGVQIIYIWVGAFRCYSQLRRYCTTVLASRLATDADIEIGLRIAVGGMATSLFMSFFVILMEMVLINSLLVHSGR